MRHIYLDYNASTPLIEEVRQAMLPFMERDYGNPSSGHWAGRPARDAVAKARGQVASLLSCSPDEVVFTSGGTEANNHALKGVFWANKGAGHIITTAVEHPAVVEPCLFLQKLGARVTWLGVDGTGLVDPDDVRRAIRPDTILVSVMLANNEVGTIQPVAEVANICRQAGVLLHTDAAQAVGKIKTKVDELGVDLLSVAGHKMYAPKGVGALYIRRGVVLESFMHGAGHESGRRAGTENVIFNVGLGIAAQSAQGRIPHDDIRELRDWFWQELVKLFGDKVVLNGHPKHRLPNTLSVAFKGHKGPDILAAMPEVAATTGSACHSGSVQMSPVLKAMGIPKELAAGTVRFSLGHQTTKSDLEYVRDQIATYRDQSASNRKETRTDEK